MRVSARTLVPQKGTKQIATVRNSGGMLVIISNVFGFLVIACVCARARTCVNVMIRGKKVFEEGRGGCLCGFVS